jgi:hypothetical protein
MLRRLNKNDFAEVNEEAQWELATSEVRGWLVCSAYELRSRCIWAKHGLTKDALEKEWRGYDPLVDTPDLFLKFARLYDQGFSTELILQWVGSYGLLGVGSGEGSGWRGGPEETVERFWEEVSWAAGILAMYEIALSGDSANAEKVVPVAFPFLELAGGGLEPQGWRWELVREVFGEVLTRELLESSRRQGLRGIEDFTRKERDLTARFMIEYIDWLYDADYLGYALEFSMGEVGGRMQQGLCYQRPELVDDKGALVPTNVRARWEYENLLGAMYLQMHWLMTSGGQLARCENCGRIIALSRPHPEGRKRRRDKRFCDDACRQAHHRSKKRVQDAPS